MFSKLKIRGFVFLFVLALAAPLSWAKIINSGPYSYDKRVWNEAFAGDGVHIIAEQTTKVLIKTITALKAEGDIPAAINTPNDLKSLIELQGKLDVVIDTINDYMESHRKDSPGELHWSSFLPDALVIYLGPKIGLNLFASLGGNAVVGLIVIPQRVKKISNRTGEVVDVYHEFEVGLTVWPQVGAGVGFGGGAGVVGGLGLLWNTRDDIESVSDIPNAVGGGANFAAALGTGILSGTGFLFNFLGSNPLNPVFYYVRAGLTAGVEATMNARLTAQFFLSPSSLISMLSVSQQKTLQNLQLQVQQEVSAAIEQNLAEGSLP